jgi:death-on-curing protein
MVLAIHDEALAAFGGLDGVRDAGLLDSALARPKNLHAYESKRSAFELAAALCWGLARNHPFLDANKRTALLSARAFLFLNGYAFEPSEGDEVEMLVGVADGRIDEARLAAWFAEFSRKSGAG